MDTLRTTRKCGQLAMVSRVQLPCPDCASELRFGAVPRGARRRARHGARRPHGSHARVRGSLLDPSGRPDIAGGWFTPIHRQFAPKVVFDNIDLFEPHVNALPRCRPEADHFFIRAFLKSLCVTSGGFIQTSALFTPMWARSCTNSSALKNRFSHRRLPGSQEIERGLQ